MIFLFALWGIGGLFLLGNGILGLSHLVLVVGVLVVYLWRCAPRIGR